MRLALGWILMSACGTASGQQAIEAQPGTFFVAVDGNDDWSGARASADADRTDGPFRTLQRAQQAVRAATGDRRVVLRAGTHFLPEPLVLGPEDSGTSESPVVWSAYPDEKVVLSGGHPVTGWEKADDAAWRVRLPAEWKFRQLRVGDKMQRPARHPNAVPGEPYTGGWLFAQPRMVKEGQWDATVANIHTPGDWIEWDAEVPATGEYALWVRYGAKNEPFGRTDMAGRTAFQVDGGEDVVLENLPDTAGWESFEWSKCATLALAEGTRLLRWTNRQGGGINFDAWALTTDPDWEPVGTDLAEPVTGVPIVQQAEAWKQAEGREMTRQTHFKETADALPFGEGDVPDDFDLSQADVMIFPAWGWVGGPVEVGGIDHDANIITLTGPNAQQDIRRGNRYYLRNVRQALDEPGEFFHDEETGELLYVPEGDDLEARGAVAPALDRIIHIQGDPEADTWPEHIRIEGLSFRDTTYSRAVGSLYQPDDAAIWLEHARNIDVADCTFSQLGGYAVKMLQNTTQCRVLGCTMTDMGQGGVITVGDTAGQATDSEVVGCAMSRLGRIYKHVAGVYVTTGSGIRVAHCTIADVPRYAISFKSYSGEAYSHDCIAEYNEMLRTNTETNDTGAIETLGRDREATGNIIRYNLILDAIGMKHKEDGGLISPFYTWGIYLDDYSSGTHVYGNIVARNYRGGYHNHLGFDNVVENNVFVDGLLYQAEYNGGADMRRNVFRRNIVAYSNPDAVYMRSGGWNVEVLAECDHNLLWWTGGDILTTGSGITPQGPWAKWLEAGFDESSIVADPLFVDAENDDYRLADDSPAWDLGFERIPVERIGVKGWDGE